MNGGYVMIDLGTFGFNNAIVNKSAVDKIKKNIGLKPLYVSFERVDEFDEELTYVGKYTFFANVFEEEGKYYISLISYDYSDDARTIYIEINKNTSAIVIKDILANYTE